MYQVNSIVKKILLLSALLVFGWQLTAIAADDVTVPQVVNEITYININTASPEQLADGLNGIGLKRAQAIVEYREANGAFTSADQLLEIKGIGEKTLEKNRKLILIK